MQQAPTAAHRASAAQKPPKPPADAASSTASTPSTQPARPPTAAWALPAISLPQQQHAPVHTSSSVSSPSAPDSDIANEVDELLEGIDRARIDDLCPSPHGSRAALMHSHPFSSVFAPPLGTGPPFTSLPDALPAFAPLASPPTDPPTPPANDLDPFDLAAAVPSAHQQHFQHHQHHQHHQHQHHHLAAHAGGLHPHQYHQSHQNHQNHQYQHHQNHQHHQHLSHSPASPPNDALSSAAPAPHDFPRLFKVYPCPTRAACEASGDTADCFYYHAPGADRRRAETDTYKPHMCRFVDGGAGCRKADACPFAHNDFERRYHPDRFGKETCRDFLRGDCPRRFCTFRHHVSRKVEVALAQLDAMADKELLQLVLKLSDARGRALCDKLLRRFGHAKKHSGWKLEGFDGRARDDAQVRRVAARVDAVRRRLRAAGEKKWAATLKTTGLRDMMSGVRKVAEEMRERCRADANYVDTAASEPHRLIRAVFSNTNWSCHSHEGDNPFLVTPDNQGEAVSALERLVETLIEGGGDGAVGATTTGECA